MSEKKERIAFFDTKPYDRVWFDQLNRHYHIKYYEHKLTPDSVSLAQGCRAVIPFVTHWTKPLLTGCAKPAWK